MAAAQLCLKARPTAAQLADRLRPIDGRWPDGLELYLAGADIASPAVMDDVVARIESYHLPADFALLIEGPFDSLDGADFDPTRDSDADRQVIVRLADLARRLRARAVNIHLIAPSSDVGRLTLDCRAALLERSLGVLREFVTLTLAAGAVPTIENMPPVLRMRRADYAFTPIGMASADLHWVAERVPGLRVLVDTSHAGLYLNARAGVDDATEHAWYMPLVNYCRQLPAEQQSLVGYVQSFGALLENAQIANAAGILGEGLPYGTGDFALDPVIGWLGANTRHIVTETLEERNDTALNMVDALQRMRRVVA